MPETRTVKRKKARRLRELTFLTLLARYSPEAANLIPSIGGHPRQIDLIMSEEPRKNELPVHVFKGKGYEDWRWCFQKALGEKNLRSLMIRSDEGTRYIDANDETRYGNEMATYTSKQDRAQSMLAERLDSTYIKKTPHLCISPINAG